jgi:hypothetical protein
VRIGGTIVIRGIGCLDSKSGIKNLFGFRARNFQISDFSTPVWLQAGYYLAPAAQTPAELKLKRGVSPYYLLRICCF